MVLTQVEGRRKDINDGREGGQGQSRERAIRRRVSDEERDSRGHNSARENDGGASRARLNRQEQLEEIQGRKVQVAIED